MKKHWIALGVAALVVVILISWLIGTYNSFVSQRQNADTAWAQIETQYQRRFDLIPNLTASAKGYLTQEKDILDNIAQARTKYAGSPSGSTTQVQAAGQLDGFFSRLMVIMENYPNLKSDQTVRDLMTELEGTENRINVARQRYNESVQSYNVAIRSFPSNMLANMYGFQAKELYQADKGASVAPTVNLENIK